MAAFDDSHRARRTGSRDASRLAEVEYYARADFLIDVARGESDPQAIARRSAKVADSPASIPRWCDATTG